MRRVAAAAFAACALGANASGAISATTTPDAAWGGVPVLMYHKVDPVVPADAVGRDLTVAPQTFDAQMRWLRDHHIRTLTAAELVAALRRGERPRDAIVLTFDDGYEDAATVVAPILERYGARATFFVSAGFVGTPRHLTWREMRTMRAAGQEIACHGTFHLDLSQLDRAGQQAEAGHCVDAFARWLGGYRPVTYAYPAGQYDATTFDVLAKLGVLASFTEHPGAVTSLAHPLELPRRRVHRDDDLQAFAAVATP